MHSVNWINLDQGPAHLRNHLVDWNTEQGLLLYCGQVYVSKDNALQAEIVHIHHNLPTAGHPGQAKTVELVITVGLEGGDQADFDR